MKPSASNATGMRREKFKLKSHITIVSSTAWWAANCYSNRQASEWGNDMVTGTVSKLARMGYSAAAFSAGISLYALVGAAIGRPSTPKQFLVSFLWLCLPGVIFAIPGWVIAIPLVLLISRIDGWRFWMLLAVGASIGPIAIASFALWAWVAAGENGRPDTFGPAFFLLGTAVAAITTLTYLLLLHRAQRRVGV
jgi:hypothetical protein